MIVNHEFTVDIQSPVKQEMLGFDIVKGDGGSHVISVTLLDNGAVADLTDTVAELYTMRSDGETVHAEMNKTDNVVSAAMPVEASAITEKIEIQVHLAKTGETLTVLNRYTTVRDGITDVIVDPGNTIPSIDALLAQISNMENKTAAITGITAEAEMLADSSVPTASATPDPGDGHINIAMGFPRPPKTWSGEAITGTSTTPTAYATGITYAMVDDLYIYKGATDAEKTRVYRCTAGGNAATALWVYDNNWRGAAGAAITTASQLPIADAGAYFPTDNVEAALQTAGAANVAAALAIVEKAGYGIISGLAVAAQSTPNMTVNVASGVLYKADGTRQAPTANAALAVTAADATNPRIDIVYISSAGVVSYLAGTAAATPTIPSVPSGGLLDAQINVTAAATTITNTMIVMRQKLVLTENRFYPDMQNGATASTPVSVRKDADGTVFMRGILTVATSGVTVFTLPAGYRPNISEMWYKAFAGSAGAGNVADVRVMASGEVRIYGYLTGVSLAGVVFKADL
ncbi:MAG: phage baseplate upper protein [Eubacteriales bacterium]|nr:phage baseplate upper protein [Eubacteriales bacterium]